MEPLCPFHDHFVKEEGINGLSIQFQPEMGDNNFYNSDINTFDSEDELGVQGVGAQEKVEKEDTESANTYPDLPLWIDRICDLLNDVLASLGSQNCSLPFGQTI